MGRVIFWLRGKEESASEEGTTLDVLGMSMKTFPSARIRLYFCVFTIRGTGIP